MKSTTGRIILHMVSSLDGYIATLAKMMNLLSRPGLFVGLILISTGLKE